MSTAAQKKAIKDFKAVTDASDKVATDVLTKCEWNLERALDSFFSNRNQYPEGKKGDGKKIEKIFAQYADPESKEDLSGEFLLAFLKEIDLDANKAESLLLPFKLKCKEIGIITRSEFIDGFANLGIDTVQKMKSEFERFKKGLSEHDSFKPFYIWIFEVSTEGKKTMPKDKALALWPLLLQDRWALSGKWVAFVEDDKNNIKSVSRDLWSQVYEFSRDIKGDLSNYDAANGAWPAAIDEFADSVLKGKK